MNKARFSKGHRVRFNPAAVVQSDSRKAMGFLSRLDLEVLRQRFRKDAKGKRVRQCDVVVKSNEAFQRTYTGNGLPITTRWRRNELVGMEYTFDEAVLI